MKDPYSVACGARIKALRKASGLSQRDLGRHVDRSDAAISYWESGKTAPDLDGYLTLAKVLQSTPAYIAFGVSP